jgi:amidohydrolase
MDLAAIRREIAMHQDAMVSLRRDLHRNPEIGLDLPRTQAAVLTQLEGLRLEIGTGQGLSSVTAVLRGRKKGPVVLLRGDMDALPVTEETGLPFSSEIDGVMHACGHDLHTAMLVTAAKVLSTHADDLAGDIVFMFQPGEEGHFGARQMIEEGVLEAAGRPVSAAYGVHVKSAGIPLGVFTSRPNALMAANDGARITISGRGGHGAAPHLANDPIPAAATLVNALQTMVTRKFDIFDPVVVTVGIVQAGTKNNIIPDFAVIEATIRTFSARSRERVRAEITQLAQHIAAAHGVVADVDYRPGYPVTVNHPEHARRVASTLTDTFGAERFVEMTYPLAATEDFSYVLEKVPGCYLFLGAEPAGAAVGEDNHSPRAIFDESVLADGVLMHAVLALQALGATSESAVEQAAVA